MLGKVNATDSYIAYQFYHGTGLEWKNCFFLPRDLLASIIKEFPTLSLIQPFQYLHQHLRPNLRFMHTLLLFFLFRILIILAWVHEGLT